MAEILAKKYGTQEDKVNCPFYFKIGACRYQDQCLRNHIRPPYSQTILIQKMYKNLPVELAIASGNEQAVSRDDAELAREHFQQFYSEVFRELMSYGEIEDMLVCDNIGDHMIGNVYVKYSYQEDAIKAFQKLKTRYYDGGLLKPEFSPATDFSNAKCKQYIESSCKYGGYCNYIHLKHISSSVKKQLFNEMFKENPGYKNSRGRDRDRERDDSSSRRRKKSRDRQVYRSKSRSRSGSRDQQKQHKHRKEERSRKSRSRSKSPGHKQDRRRGGDDDNRRRKSQSEFSNSQERRKAIASWQNDQNSDTQQ